MREKNPFFVLVRRNGLYNIAVIWPQRILRRKVKKEESYKIGPTLDLVCLRKEYNTSNDDIRYCLIHVATFYIPSCVDL
jgi:hypothetical protein